MYEEKNEQPHPGSGSVTGGKAGKTPAIGAVGRVLETAGQVARDAAGHAEQVEGDPGGDGGDIPEEPVAPHYLYVMTSDVGMLKVGISNSPLNRLISVKYDQPDIQRVRACWVMSARDARLIEREVHKKLLPFRIKGEFFQTDDEIAMVAIKESLPLYGLPVEPVPPPTMKIPSIIIRVASDMKRDAEQAAANDGRTLSSWVERLIAAELKRAEPPRKRPK